MEIQWEEPPEHALQEQRTSRYREFAAELRKHPGQWAVLPGERSTADSARNTFQNLKGGRMKPFPRGEFEAAIDGMKIYVRYQPGGAPTTNVASAQPAGPIGEEDHSPKAEAVRRWARANGLEVAERGRISADVHEAYKQAHPTGDA